MIKSTLCLFIALALTVTARAVIITNFGATVTVIGSTGFTYNSGSSLLGGSENGGDVLYNVSPLSLNLTGATGLSLSAAATTTPAGTFSITLTDNTGKLAVANGFSWSSFLSGPNTVQKAFTTVNAGFDYANVTDFSLDSGGSGQAISITLNQLQSIPEPSTYALMAIGTLLVGGVCLKRKSVKI